MTTLFGLSNGNAADSLRGRFFAPTGVSLQRLTVKRLTIYPLALKMKRKVSHAASVRAVSEPIVVAIELSDGTIGYGETLPRLYVTGETNESVIELLRGDFVKELLAFRPQQFPEALEAVEALPMLSERGEPCPAARAAVELALLDALLRRSGRSLNDVTGWMGLPGFGSPGSIRSIRYSLVLASDSIGKIRRNARLARLAGMRHFKLKVGFPDDDARVHAVADILWRFLRSGRATLRLDANGAWGVDQAADSLSRWKDVPIAGIEQPLPKGSEDELPSLCERTNVPIFHDESLVTMEDAQRLVESGVAGGFNIRISKCGGLMPALRLAAFARSRGVAIQLGCMVGETSILSAAGVRFLEVTPRVAFCEGSFGSLLMAEDIASKHVRFGIAGRPPKLNGTTWGDRIRQELLEQHCLDKPIVLEL